PGGPSAELIAESRRDSEPEAPAEEAAPFPGDEPTRIEPVSAALLDKLRERDEELLAAETGPAAEPAQQGWGSLVPEEAAPETAAEPPAEAEAEAPPAESPPEANVTMQDFSMPAVNEADPDEPHWRETYDRFRELK